MVIFEVLIIRHAAFPSDLRDNVSDLRVIKLHSNDNRYLCCTMLPSTFADYIIANNKVASCWRLDTLEYDATTVNGFNFRHSGYQVK